MEQEGKMINKEELLIAMTRRLTELISPENKYIAEEILAVIEEAPEVEGTSAKEETNESCGYYIVSIPYYGDKMYLKQTLDHERATWVFDISKAFRFHDRDEAEKVKTYVHAKEVIFVGR